MPILWTEEAMEHLHDAHAYLVEQSVDAATRQMEAVVSAVKQLNQFPSMGRMGRVQGTRELVVQGTPYIVAYRVKGGAVQVLAVMHGAQRWPRRFS